MYVIKDKSIIEGYVLYVLGVYSMYVCMCVYTLKIFHIDCERTALHCK